MIWVAWRRSRTQTLAALALLLALATVVAATGPHLHDALLRSPSGAGDDRPLANALGPALITLPSLLGMFWGAPLVARELETGTFRLAWTQSITRRRWLLLSLAAVGGTAIAVTGLASWMVSWWYAPLDTVRADRLDPTVFAARGSVVVGYTAFAFALGVASGTLTRRTLPAMVSTLAGFAAALAASTFWLISHLPFAQHALVSVSAGANARLPVNFQFAPSASGAVITPHATPIPNGLVLSSALTDRAGHAISTAQLHTIFVSACPAFVPRNQLPRSVLTIDRKQTNASFQNCGHQLARHLRELITYQPPGHYWLLQGLITAIYLTAAAALIGLALRQCAGRRSPRRKAVDHHRTETAKLDVPADISRR